jgi:hypothetical protein
MRCVRLWAVLVLAVGCGNDEEGPSTNDDSASSASCGFAPCTTGVTAGDTEASSSGDTGDGTIAPCSSHDDEPSCLAGDPGDGQHCGWVAYHAATVDDTETHACSYEPAGFTCVQQLGDTGGTPFGSCGGDGSPPVYWRMESDGTVLLIGSDGFSTPDGWDPCDCHDDNPHPDDPLECCCSCGLSWPPP